MYIAQRWLILTWSVQNIKNMSKLKGIILTNEILRDLRLGWVSDGYPPTLDSPVGARFFQLYRVTRPKPGVTEICARGVFFLSLLQSNMKSCTIFLDTSMVNITYINITYINDCTVTYIHALHTPRGSRCIPRAAPSVNEIYLPKHSWRFYRWKFNLTSVMRF